MARKEDTGMTVGRAAGRGPAGRFGGGPVVIVAAVFLAAGPAGLLPAGAAPVPGSSPTGPPTAVPSTPPTSGDNPDLARGGLLYQQTCASCHGPAGQGTQRGPALVGVGPASVDFQVGTGRMPLAQEARQPMRKKAEFSVVETRDIVAYVAGFGPGGPPIPQVRPGSVATGSQLYLANCAACHSATGSGGALTNAWTAPSLSGATPTQVAEAVRVGPGLMPAFPQTVFTDAQVDALASYVQELQGDRLDRGGAALGRLGPATEGLVAWAVGLVLLVMGARWLGSRAGE